MQEIRKFACATARRPWSLRSCTDRNKILELPVDIAMMIVRLGSAAALIALIVVTILSLCHLCACSVATLTSEDTDIHCSESGDSDATSSAHTRSSRSNSRSRLLRAQRMVAWAKTLSQSQGCQGIMSSLEPRVTKGGIGMFAVADVRASDSGHAAGCIPWTHTIGAGSFGERCVSIFRDHSAGSDHLVELAPAVCCIFELLGEVSLGPSSRVAPWIQNLPHPDSEPEMVRTFPLYWSEEKIQMASSSARMKNHLDRVQTLLQVVRGLLGRGPWASQVEVGVLSKQIRLHLTQWQSQYYPQFHRILCDESSLQRAVALFGAYGFGVNKVKVHASSGRSETESESGTCTTTPAVSDRIAVLVPYADLFNHHDNSHWNNSNSEPNCEGDAGSGSDSESDSMIDETRRSCHGHGQHRGVAMLHWNHDENFFFLHVSDARPSDTDDSSSTVGQGDTVIRAGDEVFVSYGSGLCQSDVMARYGFIALPSKASNNMRMQSMRWDVSLSLPASDRLIMTHASDPLKVSSSAGSSSSGFVNGDTNVGTPSRNGAGPDGSASSSSSDLDFDQRYSLQVGRSRCITLQQITDVSDVHFQRLRFDAATRQELEDMTFQDRVRRGDVASLINEQRMLTLHISILQKTMHRFANTSENERALVKHCMPEFAAQLGLFFLDDFDQRSSKRGERDGHQPWMQCDRELAEIAFVLQCERGVLLEAKRFALEYNNTLFDPKTAAA